MTIILKDAEFATRVTDKAHEDNGTGHVEGFCKACAEIYVAVIKALKDDD
jgi:hypothetical protein